MAGRYDFTRRSSYTAEDMDSGRPARAIGAALEQYLRGKQEETNWENDVSMNGGQLSPEGPGAMDKLRGIGGAIRRHLPGYNPVPEAEQNLDANRTRVMTPQITTTSGGPNDQALRMPVGSGALDDGTSPATNVVTYRPGANRLLDTPGTARDGVTRSPIANALESELQPSTENGDGIERGIIRGPSGRTAIMPTATGRATMAARSTNSEWDRRQGIEHRNKIEEIQANPRQSLSVADRLAIEDRKGQIAAARVQLTAKLRSSDPLAAARIKAQLHALDLRERALDQGDVRLGTEADLGVLRIKPPDTFGNDDPAVAGDAAEIADTQREARKRLRARGRGASGLRVLSQEQYDRALSQGHTDAEIAAGYDVSGVKRRK